MARFNSCVLSRAALRVGVDVAFPRQVAVMTTEVFRNMLYDSDEAENGLANVFAVVFDEFHYMNDRDRGTVSTRAGVSIGIGIGIGV